MIRTKYFVIVILGIILGVFLVLAWSKPKVVEAPVQSEEVIFSVPKDSYGVIKQNLNSWEERRAIFVGKVRSALLREDREEKPTQVSNPEPTPEPVPVPEPVVQIPEAVVSEAAVIIATPPVFMSESPSTTPTALTLPASSTPSLEEATTTVVE
jgi:hypothetical protein